MGPTDLCTGLIAPVTISTHFRSKAGTQMNEEMCKNVTLAGKQSVLAASQVLGQELGAR